MLHVAGVALVGGAVYVGTRTARWLDRKRHPDRWKLAALAGDADPVRPVVPVAAEEPAADETGQEIRRNLKVATAAVGLAAGGAMLYPPLSLLSVPFTLYAAVDLFKDAYRGLAEERRFKATLLDSLAVAGTLAAGYYFLGALANWLFYVGSGLVQRTRDQSRQNLARIFEVQPRRVWVQQDGLEIETAFEALLPGQRVVIRAGESIPVDGEIVEGIAGIDQRMLTGESQPVEKTVGERVFAATLVLSGRIVVRVEQTGTATVAAQIGEMLQRTVDFKSTVELQSQDLSNRLTLPTLGLGAMTWLTLGLPSAVALISANFSEVLRIASPLGLLNYLNIATRQGILIKDGRSLELLAEVDTVVFDKTGTLTLEQPVVDRVHACGAWSEDILLAYAAAAEFHQTHPVALAIRQAAEARGLDLPAIDEACYELGYGVKVACDGLKVAVGSGRFMTLEGIELPDPAAAIEARSHAEGHSLIYVALGGRLGGLIELHAALRPEARAVVERLKARGLTLYILSGDHAAPTRRLAEALGIDRYFAEVLPAAKADYVDRLQGEGRQVCFIGDGINDAVALKKATVSISLNGASAAATDTAQILLMDKTLEQLDRVFALSREMNANLKAAVLTTLGPGILCAGGVIFLHWQILATIVMYNGSLLAGVANAMLPLLPNQNNRLSRVDE